MASIEKDLSDRVARLESITKIYIPNSYESSYTDSSYMGTSFGGYQSEDINSAFFRLEAKLARLEKYLSIQEVKTPAKVEYVKLDKK